MIADVLNHADYQSNDVGYLQSLLFEDYQYVFGRGHSLHSIIMVRPWQSVKSYSARKCFELC